MPIKDKIELLTPQERKEWDKLEAYWWDNNHTFSEEEKKEWFRLDKLVSKERILNMTPEELKAQQDHDKAWEERNKYMEENGFIYF